MEANTLIYNTNYINNTVSAMQLIDEVKSDGFKLNLDVGTMIQTEETINELQGRVKHINHIHTSKYVAMLGRFFMLYEKQADAKN